MRQKLYKLALYLLAILSVSFMSPVYAKNGLLLEDTAQRVDPFLPLMPRKGDLVSIKQYGHLRVLFAGDKVAEYEFGLLEDFASSNDLKIVYISIKKLNRGQELLRSGLADILLGTSHYSKFVSKTLPINTHNNDSVLWSVRSENNNLKNALNHHLNYFQISENSPENYQEDLPDLKKRKLLRVVTRPDPHNYFLRKGLPAGFEYELLQRFAKEQGLWLEVIIANDEAEMLEWVKEGKADLATIVSTDFDEQEIATSFPFYPAKNFIITRKSEKKLQDLYDINGKELALHSEKYQHQGIEYLMDKGLVISTIDPESSLPTSTFLQRVIDREYEVAMVSARKYIDAHEFHDELKVITTVNDQPLHRWAVNINNIALKETTNTFLRNEFQGEFFNIVYKRYYPEKQKILDDQLDISPYDQLVKKYAEQYKFDWRLVLAQMYQESQFKPDALSTSGAKGLMQIMPRTAKELRYSKVEDPETGIKAGLKYMKKLRDRYGKELTGSERNWFALASYNAGYERIQDARKFAEELGYDSDRWFGHVELAMQKLAKPENRKYTRFGFCRCGQTVVYVRNIRKLYNSYIQLSDPLIVAASGQKLLTDNRLDRQRSPF